MLKEPIYLSGVRIVDAKYMKQSRVQRYTIELTEQDSKQFSGSLALFQPHDIISDITILPVGREGEDNGYEHQLDHVHTEEENRI